LTVAEPPASVVSQEAKLEPQGNGRKPVRKSVSSKGETPETPQTPVPPAPAPSIVLPPAPPIPKLVEVFEPVAPAATPAPSQSPPARDIRPAEPALLEAPSSLAPRPARLAGTNGGAVVLGLGMEVISVQFTPRFQIGTIRARPTGTALSLTQLFAPTDSENRWGAGFELGPVELDSAARIRTMRVRPTRKPAESIQTHNGFAINDVKLVDEAACIQFTAGTSVPMTMQLVAVFKVAGVELSDRFEVAQLVLQPEGSRVRITLEPQVRGTAGTEFETVGVRLDASGRITEFLLSSVQSDQPERRVHVA
jgi:hypothetical protein